MQNKFALLLIAAAIGSTGAGAMTAVENGKHTRCEIVEGGKYLSPALGASSICSTIERTISAETPAATYSVKIKVLSPSRLAAALIVNGRALPEHKFAVMDRNLNIEAVQRFARALAADVAKSAKG